MYHMSQMSMNEYFERLKYHMDKGAVYIEAVLLVEEEIRKKKEDSTDE